MWWRWLWFSMIIISREACDKDVQKIPRFFPGCVGDGCTICVSKNNNLDLNLRSLQSCAIFWSCGKLSKECSTELINWWRVFWSGISIIVSTCRENNNINNMQTPNKMPLAKRLGNWYVGFCAATNYEHRLRAASVEVCNRFSELPEDLCVVRAMNSFNLRRYRRLSYLSTILGSPWETLCRYKRLGRLRKLYPKYHILHEYAWIRYKISFASRMNRFLLCRDSLSLARSSLG